ncbi:shikimate kinase [Neobacillus bataviensis LMG 21833]|uniref:Shikimate kinase n=1 Tax=Neobacillus bataviensis LMG 21833 TaxID=1117379 RepID=K6EE00_9BACI|nr:shikimate kinase [Neobacillus bataviensis]EKN71711.1 shikimate kinase [Neobacillus bataviensis LMG 21833]
MTNKSIVFIGFMGVGKTTIGRMVAEKLGREFIDIDEEIEKEYAMKVSDIFEKIGEMAFRDKEKSVITSLCEQKGKVLSLGGGAFLQEDIRKVCLSSSFVILLDLSFDKWKERLNLIIDSRPVLKGKSLSEMEELFYKRQEVYAKHHLKVNTDDQDPEEITDLIIHAVNEKV